MTLKEWSEKTGILATEPTEIVGVVSIDVEPSTLFYTHLWGLSDYKVSAVSGPIIWLVPVEKENADQS